PLGLDLRDAGVREALLERPAQLEVLVEQLRVVAVRVPPRPPRLVEPEAESERMNLLTHRCSFSVGSQQSAVSSRQSAVTSRQSAVGSRLHASLLRLRPDLRLRRGLGLFLPTATCRLVTAAGRLPTADR